MLLHVSVNIKLMIALAFENAVIVKQVKDNFARVAPSARQGEVDQRRPQSALNWVVRRHVCSLGHGQLRELVLERDRSNEDVAPMQIAMLYESSRSVNSHIMCAGCYN